MTEQPIVFEPDIEAAPAPVAAERPELRLRLECRGELVAESTDEKLWARVLVLLLEAERPECPS